MSPPTAVITIMLASSTLRPFERADFDFKTNEAGVIVSIADPKGIFALVDNPAVRPIAEEADQRLRRVIAALQ